MAADDGKNASVGIVPEGWTEEFNLYSHTPFTYTSTRPPCVHAQPKGGILDEKKKRMSTYSSRE